MTSPINQKSLLLILCLLLIAWSWWRILGDDSSRPNIIPEDQTWYWDPVKRKTFAAASLQIPPIESPWGNASPRVYFFSCGACTEAERFPGFFMKFTPAMQVELQADPDRWGAAFAESHPGRMYSTNGLEWMEADSIEATGLNRKLAQRCPGRLSTCR